MVFAGTEYLSGDLSARVSGFPGGNVYGIALDNGARYGARVVLYLIRSEKGLLGTARQPEWRP